MDVRHYYYPDASGIPAPTKKGVNLPAEDTMALLGAIEAIEAAETGDPIQVDVDVRNPIFISRSMYRGSLRLDVRHYYDDNGRWQPTRKGVSLPMAEREQLPVTHADAMTDLPDSLQREALKLLGRANPTFEQFKQYLVQLEPDQYQQMDLTEMWAGLLQQGAERQAAMRGGSAELITSEVLSPVRADRRDTVGDIVVRYIHDLAEAG